MTWQEEDKVRWLSGIRGGGSLTQDERFVFGTGVGERIALFMVGLKQYIVINRNSIVHWVSQTPEHLAIHIRPSVSPNTHITPSHRPPPTSPTPPAPVPSTANSRTSRTASHSIPPPCPSSPPAAPRSLVLIAAPHLLLLPPQLPIRVLSSSTYAVSRWGDWRLVQITTQ